MNKASAQPRAKTPSKATASRSTKAAPKVKEPVTTLVRAKTLRLEPAFEVGLGILKGVLRKPVNKMVNEAVGEYIQRRSAEVETALTGTLERLKAYRLADPNFEQDRDAFIAAEARYGKRDPMEGVAYDVEPPAAMHAENVRAGKSKAGPALAMVRELLRN